MTSRPLVRAAAVASAAALVVSGAQAAHAATGSAGQLDLGSLGSSAGATVAPTDPANPSPAPAPAPRGSLGNLDSGSLKAYGQSPQSGSLLQGADDTGVGSLDTRTSSLGEPTSGSLSGLVSGVEGSADFSSPAEGTGSVDTTKGSLGEPTSGSLAGLWAPLAVALGLDQGITTILGSVGTGASAGSVGALLPLVLVGGSVALGIAAAPMIQNTLSANRASVPPGSFPPPANPVVPPARGPEIDNGRGGEPGVATGGVKVDGMNYQDVTLGSLGTWEVPLPAGVVLPAIPGVTA